MAGWCSRGGLSLLSTIVHGYVIAGKHYGQPFVRCLTRAANGGTPCGRKGRVSLHQATQQC